MASMRRLVASIAATLLASCGGGGSVDMVTSAGLAQRASASASCSSITQLLVPVNSVQLPTGQQSFSPPKTIDLQATQSGLLQALGLAPLEGAANVQVKLSTGEGTVQFADGSTASLKIPGGTTVSASTQVAAGDFADLVVPSFDPCTSLHAAGNSGQWLLTGNVSARMRTLPFSTRTQLAPGVLRPLPGGGWVVVQSDGNGGFTFQRFDSFGNAIGGTVDIAPPASNALSVAVTPLVSGYLLTWLGPTLDPTMPLAARFPLMAQFFDNSGQSLGAPEQVAITTPFTSRIAPPSPPSVAALPDGGAAIVYVRQGVNTLDVFLERISANGTVGPEQMVNVSTSVGMPEVTALANGNVLVVWGTGTVYARVFAPDSTAGAQQTLTTQQQLFSGPVSVSAAPDGGAAVAWVGTASSGIVFFERLGPDGAPTTAAQGVTGVPSAPSASQASPSVAVLADNTAVVAWVEGGNSPILARRFAADGTPLGAAQVIYGSESVAPIVVPLSWGGFLIEASTPGGLVVRMFDAQALEG